MSYPQLQGQEKKGSESVGGTVADTALIPDGVVKERSPAPVAG
jgi:hypothetical protein